VAPFARRGEMLQTMPFGLDTLSGNFTAALSSSTRSVPKSKKSQMGNL
jgi:hypothetical protein